MGYTKNSYKILMSLKEKSLFDGLKSIVELGSQDIEPELLTIFCSHKESKQERVSAKQLYYELGFSKYECIDFDGAHNALSFDLNCSLKEKYQYKQTFDVVTVMGTAEHVFNQAMLFENIHYLCRDAGLIILSTPIRGWNNHGFFNYHPKFFYKLAIANQYNYVSAWASGDKLISLQNLNDPALCDITGDTSLTIVLQKNTSNPFCFPTDGTIMDSRIAKIYKINNPCMATLRFFGYKNIYKVAIFGSAHAAKKAYTFFEKAEIEVVCFVDDYKIGSLYSAPIVAWEDFTQKFQCECSHLVKGPLQSGNIEEREGLLIPIISMDPSWF